MAGMCIIFAWYGIIYILMPHLSTFVTSLLSHLLQPSVCCGEVVCAGQGRAGLQGGLKWPRLPLSSQSNLAGSYLPSIRPSTHPSGRPSVRPSSSPSASCLARVPAAASHITEEPGLHGCCSESSESPIWSAGETEEWQGQRTAIDQMYFSQGQSTARLEQLSTQTEFSFSRHSEETRRA